jgi:LmbE family N-acetylglucosaminyl deacetylase
MFSPHPDDEVITGALPLRLLRRSRWYVVNVAVTLGSNPERRAERLAELKACCDCIGFALALAAPNGLEQVTAKAREQSSADWARSVKTIADLLIQYRPRVIFFPHDADWHATHIGTNLLVRDALGVLPADFSCFTLETEFWRPMESPNLMVEVNATELGDLVTALTFHVGEVKRNPYHLTLPAWMVDNVRRGSEWMSGQGAAAPDFAFATLYRGRRWKDGKLEPAYDGGKVLGSAADPATLF